MKILLSHLFQILFILKIVCAEWITLERNFEAGYNQTQIDLWDHNTNLTNITSTCFNAFLIGGYNKFSQNTILSRNFTDIPSHDRIRITFAMYQIDLWEDMERSEVYVDGNLEFEKEQPINQFLPNFCGDPNDGDAFHFVQFEVPHNQTNLFLEIRDNLDQDASDESWGITNFFIEFQLPEFIPHVNIDECAESIDPLLNETQILMTSQCTDFVESSTQKFEFLVRFLRPFYLNPSCFDLEVLFESEVLNQNIDGDLQNGAVNDEWVFDVATQELKWNIQLDDFVDKYNCELHNETNTTTGAEEYIWMCDYDVNILYLGNIQVTYQGKLQVTLNRGALATGQIQEIQFNSLDLEIEGHCCENTLNITTVLQFCDNFFCDNYLSSPQQIQRGEEFFVEHKITSLEFDHYYLKHIDVKLGNILVTVVDAEFGLPGRVILKLRSNIATNSNQPLTVISKIHRTQPLLRRYLQTEDIGDNYMLKGEVGLNILSYSEINPDNNDQNKDQKSQQQQDEVVYQTNKKIKQNQKINQQKMILFGVLALFSVTLISIGSFILVKKYRKGKKLGNRLSKYTIPTLPTTVIQTQESEKQLQI